jgi:hypothetical protein
MTRRGPRRLSVALCAAALAVILLALVVLPGCGVQTGVDTAVKEDGSGTVAVRLVADKELQNALSGAVGALSGRAGAILGILGELGGTGGLPTTVDGLFNLILGQIPGDWNVEQGTDSSGARWITLTHVFADSKELEQLLSGRLVSTIMDTSQLSLTQDHGFFSTKTAFAATAEAGSVTSRAQSVTGLAQGALSDLLTVQSKVTLPGTIKDNNADEVQGNTLVWNLGTSGPKDMRAASTVYNGGAIAGIAIVGAAILAGIIVAAILIARRRRPKPGPGQPVAVQPIPSEPTPGTAPESATTESASAEPAPGEQAPSEQGPAEQPAENPAVDEPTVTEESGDATSPVVPHEAAEATSSGPNEVPVADGPMIAAEPAIVAEAVASVAEPQDAPASIAVAPAGETEVPTAAEAAAPASQADSAPEAEKPQEPKPVVPIPLRPTKTEPARYYRLRPLRRTSGDMPVQDSGEDLF